VGMMTLFPSGPPVMAKFLGLWFVSPETPAF